MDDVAGKTLDELLQVATQLNVLDGCEKIDGLVTFHLGNRSLTVRERFARIFLVELLRGYELASKSADHDGA